MKYRRRSLKNKIILKYRLTKLFYYKNGIIQLLFRQERVHVQQKCTEIGQSVSVRHYNRDFVPGLAVCRRLMTAI